LRLPDRTISVSDPVSRGVHRDVTTAVFDFKALLNYEGKTLPEQIKNRIEVRIYKKTGDVSELALRFGPGPAIETVTVNRLPRGVYEVEVRFIPTQEAIFRRTFDISVVNVGTVQAEAALPFTDLSFEVTDMRGRPLAPLEPGWVRVEPEDVRARVDVAGHVATIIALYTGAPVTITVTYVSPDYGESADISVRDTAEGIKAKLVGGRTLQLPVGDVTVTVVDRKGQPMGGAMVKLGPSSQITGGDGRAVFEKVPLERGGRGIPYTLSVIVDGIEVTPADARSVELSTARTSVTVIGELFSLPVRVIGTLGQGLAGANVRVVKGAVTVASASDRPGRLRPVR
jgi:hypothetical protein